MTCKLRNGAPVTEVQDGKKGECGSAEKDTLRKAGIMIIGFTVSKT